MHLAIFFAVLDEIASVLLSKQLIRELVKPQPIYSHQQVRDLIEDVAQSSCMRLDPVSMNKLWDLITMVFKWQATLSSDVIKVTATHLSALGNYVMRTNTKMQLQRVQNIINNFGKIFTQDEHNVLREEILDWLKIFNIRVSLLLRLGLQNQEGTFIVNNSDPLAQEILKNLGENVYAATENGKIPERSDSDATGELDREANELKVFADEIIGVKRKNGQEKMLKLSINSEASGADAQIQNQKFCTIDVNKNNDQLSGLIEDLTVEEEPETALKDDLLDMLEDEV